MWRRPDFAHELLDLAADVCIEMGRALLDIGCRKVTLSDALCSTNVMSPQKIMEFGVPYLKKVYRELGYDRCEWATFMNWDTQVKLIREDVWIPASYRAFGILTEHTWDIRKGVEIARELGIAHSVIIWAQWIQTHSPLEIEEEIKRCVELTSDVPFSVFPSTISMGTPLENVDAAARALRKYGYVGT